jgi:uncharacterized small protein (DUF1192 family)
MINVASKYKQISLNLIDKLKNNDIDDIDDFLDKRQDILENINNKKLFKKILIEDGIIEIDEKIHNLLKENIDKVKIEIKEHRKSKQANNSYINLKKEKLNIFNKKV